MFVYVTTYLCLAVKPFLGTLTMLPDFRLYTCKQEVYFEKKMHFSFSLSLELAGIKHKVQAGIFLSQIFKSVCTSEQSDQSLSFLSHFLPIDRPSKSVQTVWMGTHVNLYLLLDTASNIIFVVGFWCKRPFKNISTCLNCPNK